MVIMNGGCRMTAIVGGYGMMVLSGTGNGNGTSNGNDGVGSVVSERTLVSE